MFGRHRAQTIRTQSKRPLPLAQCLAKSYKTSQGIILRGRTVTEHSLIVGEVARSLLLRTPDWLRSALFPEGSELIAASHDVGKVCPTFQKKIYTDLAEKEAAILTALKEFNPETEKQWGGHAGVSQATAEACNVGGYIPQIIGQHHGYSPNLSLRQASSGAFGGQSWQDRRCELLTHLKHDLATDFPDIQDDLQARVLAGLTTVADWIGSGALFENPHEDWRQQVEAALDLAGFIPPKIKSDLSFSEIFPFTPKQTQLSLIDATTKPGVYVLEAPMGLGKTEAALYAAYQLLAQGLATGIYFALPTQLTSDKIHDRVNEFLTHILDDQSAHKQSLLVHGNAWLKRFEMGEDANPGGAWFSQGKRGILAPFAVGTVDQALMAVMNVKHGFVRTFGLVGKVVILDEVHSYDTFTGTILDALVKALRRLHCTVIILSATLTQERRSKLLGVTPKANAYPLITAQPNQGEFQEIESEKIPDVSVSIGHHSEAAAIEEVLLRAEDGQQVLWIENTVNEAQTVYRILAARAGEFGVSCGLLHSRFLKTDRATNENAWVKYFGKDGVESRAQQGRILVGTQVLEQSLDIDADFLVTRIAPTDMLLQRLGRLWRHEETWRPQTARHEAWIIAPELAAAVSAPEKQFGPTAKVYAPYVLCRSLEVWQDVTQICLPGQIRQLIEKTYCAREGESAELRKFLYQLEKKRDKLQRLALLGLSQAVTTLPEEKAQTRHSEQDTTEVLLIRAYQHDQKKQGTWVTLLNGEKLWLPYNGRSLPRQKWREITATLMQNTVKVADYLAPKALGKKQLLWLGDYFYLGRPEEEESVQLRVALIDQSGALTALDKSNINDTYELTYDATLGYWAGKI
ncbi:MAG: CRISPR-associated helicase Cas3' [Desulfuromonas sp.]